MKTFGQLFAAGIAGVIILKLLGVLLLPLLGMLMGFLGLMFKVALVVVVVLFLVSFLRRRKREDRC